MTKPIKISNYQDYFKITFDIVVKNKYEKQVVMPRTKFKK